MEDRTPARVALADSASKPRGWWILGDKAIPNGHIVPDRYLSGDLVIEKSAYDALMESYKGMLKNEELDQQEYYALKAEAEKLAEALLWISGNNPEKPYCTYYVRTLKDGSTVPTYDEIAMTALTNWQKYLEGEK